MDQPGKVANPARGRLDRENEYFPVLVRAYRWRSLPRFRRHRTSKPQGSSKRVLPRQVSIDQLICTSLSHTHYWYEVGMLKVPAV